MSHELDPADEDGADIPSERLAALLLEIDTDLREGRSGDVRESALRDLTPEEQRLLAEIQVHLRTVYQQFKLSPRTASLPNTASATKWSATSSNETDDSEIEIHQLVAWGEPSDQFGRFKILRPLGMGGHGVVFLAQDPQLDRLVALKVPRPEVLIQASMRKRFLAEGRAAAGLAHPNIVTVFESGEIGTICYLAQDYIPGPSLAAWLQEHRPPVAERTAAEMMLQLADAVALAHNCQILHRDIKPANILLAPQPHATAAEPLEDFVPKLADFGIAKLLHDPQQTQTGSILGTPANMSPEQAAGRKELVDERADIYGLGTVFYELLTRRPLFRGENDLETLQLVINTEPPPPRSVVPHISRDLEAICLKCLEKNPQRRYHSAQQLVEDLQRFLQGRPVEARPATWLRRSWQWARRHPALGATMVSGMVAVSLLIGGLTVYGVRVHEFNQTLAEQNRRLQHTIGERDAALDERKKSQLLAETRASDLRNAYYATEVSRAAAMWQRNDIRVMVESLRPFQESSDGEPDLREFAWRYLWNQHGVKELFKQKFSEPQWTVRFNPEGTLLAAAGADSVVRLISVADFRVIQEIPTGQKEINYVLFDPQGAWLATAGDDGTVGVWNLPSGERRAVWPVWEDQVIYQIAYREKEDLLLICGKSPNVELLELKSGKKLGQLSGGHEGMIESLALSPDQRRLLTCGSDKTAGIWDLSERRLIRKLDVVGDAVGSGVWSEDSQCVALGAFKFGVSVWDVNTGEKIRQAATVNPVHALAITTDGWILAGDSAGTVAALRDPFIGNSDTPAAETRQRWSLHDQAIQGLAVSPDQRLLATASRDRQIGLFELKFTNPVRRRVLSDSLPGGHHYAVGPDRQGRVYRLSSGEILVVPQAPSERSVAPLDDREYRDLDWHDDSLYALTVHNEILRWNTSGEPQLLEIVPVTEHEFGSIEFLTSERVLGSLVKFRSNQFGVWNLPKRQYERIWIDHHAIAIAPEHRLFALARSSDFGIALHDAETLQELGVMLGHLATCADLKFSSDGRRLYSCGADHSIRIWDIQTKTERKRLAGHEAQIARLAVTSDKKTLASCDSTGSLRLWDLRTGRELFELFKHSQAFFRLDFTDDNETLIGYGELDDKLVEFRWSGKKNDESPTP